MHLRLFYAIKTYLLGPTYYRRTHDDKHFHDTVINELRP